MTTLAPPPLIETKLRPPDPRGGLVDRRRLLERLDETVARHPLTLVSAAAGWGKSTLLGAWLAGTDAAAAWVALDPSDNDPARFWRYVTEALRRAGVPVDDQAAGALAAGDGTAEAGMSSLLNAMAGRDDRTVLALDDYHAITEPAIHGLMELMVSRMPEAVRVVMTTRTDPPLGLGRLRARGALGEIRADDLRFEPDEAAELLRGGIGLALDRDEAERLRVRTEGWAAGLYLAALSLRGRPDAAAFIREFAGDDRLVVDYLAAEVLEGQPQGRREFLLRTSVLTRLTGPLCDAVTEGTGSARVLADLEGSNLFLVPLDNRREWYRYHHLFGELLRHELALAAAPGEVAALHRRAAAWHAAEGDPDDAVHHLIAAGDLDGAADLIAERWAGYQRSGWTATTQRWLGLLPPERVRADPRLCMAEALISINLGRPEEAGPWLTAAEAAASGDDRDTRASIAAGRSLEALLAGDTETALACGARAVEMSEGGGSWWRALACMARGIALHAAGEIGAARPLLEETVAVGRDCGALTLVVVALSHLSDTDFREGDVEGSARRAREAIEAAAEERHAEYPHASGAHVNLARALAVQGEVDAALEEADRGVSLARRGRSDVETAHAVVVRGEVRALAGDRDGARQAVAEARALIAGATGAANLEAIIADLERRVGGADAAAARPASAAAGGDLTERELAVLRRLTGDGSLREIASDLYVSRNTVKSQIRSIYRKLGVASREDAVATGRELGLLPRSLAG